MKTTTQSRNRAAVAGRLRALNRYSRASQIDALAADFAHQRCTVLMAPPLDTAWRG